MIHQQQSVTRLTGEWDENLHPRGPGGKFIGIGGTQRFAPEGNYPAHVEASAFPDHASVRSYLEQHFPHITWKNLEGMDLAIARQLPNHFLNLGNEYPEPMARLREVSVTQLPNNTLAQTVNGMFMDLNAVQFSDVGELTSDMQASVRQGWLATDRAPLLSMITHEFGHVIHEWLLTQDKASVTPMVSADARKAGTIASLWTMWRSSHARGANIAPPELSRYAMTSPTEGFAEAFVALQHGSDAQRALPYVRQVRALLRRVFGYQVPRYDATPVNTQNEQALVEALAEIKHEIGAK